MYRNKIAEPQIHWGSAYFSLTTKLSAVFRRVRAVGISVFSGVVRTAARVRAASCIVCVVAVVGVVSVIRFVFVVITIVVVHCLNTILSLIGCAANFFLYKKIKFYKTMKELLQLHLSERAIDGIL